MDLKTLNKEYLPLSPEERLEKLFSEYDDILFTSSFGTTAGILLYYVHLIRPNHTVYFLDTTYHFQETIEYKEQLQDKFNLKVVDILPEDWKNEFTKTDKTWTKDPDLCCSINKTEPMEKLKEGKKIWLSGLMSYQNKYRSNLDLFTKSGNLIKFHPILDITQDQKEAIFRDNNIPHHPLESKGYGSIGCAQCTVKGKGRAGRWASSGKTECGLHL